MDRQDPGSCGLSRKMVLDEACPIWKVRSVPEISEKALGLSSDTLCPGPRGALLSEREFSRP